jgi:hypothetical protein
MILKTIPWCKSSDNILFCFLKRAFIQIKYHFKEGRDIIRLLQTKLANDFVHES